MKKNLLRFLSLLFLVVLLSNCGKRNDIVWIYYDETRCADRWEPNHSNETLKNNIVAYFDEKGMHIYDLEIFSDRTPEQCVECLCKTGRRIKAKIKGKDIKGMKAEGFYE